MADGYRRTAACVDEAGELMLEPADADGERLPGFPPGCCRGRLARPADVQGLLPGAVKLLRPFSPGAGMQPHAVDEQHQVSAVAQHALGCWFRVQR